MGVYIDEEIVKELKKIAIKEDDNLKTLHKKIILEYIKQHGDGNPAFTLDQFVDNPQMKAAPAFFRTINDWDKYLYTADSKEVKEIVNQAQSISARGKNRLVQRGEPLF